MDKPKDPNRRFQILALIDGTHRPPAKPKGPGWPAAAIAEAFSISPFTVTHILSRQKSFGLVDCSPGSEATEIRRKVKGGGVAVWKLPWRTLFWIITDRGRSRLEWAGGHKKWCPICSKR